MAGYSGTPLWKKLGLRPGQTCCCLNAPENYAAMLGPDAPAVQWQTGLAPGLPFIHLFTPHRAEVEATLSAVLPLMARDGMIWVSWPKRASKRPTDITEDVLREVALPMGLVDIKVCAVDDIWSALKFVIRKELR